MLGALASSADGRLVVAAGSTLAAGLAAAFLLGNHPRRPLAPLGLLLGLGCAALIVANDPLRDAGELLTIPTLVAVAWLAGLTLRERSEAAAAAGARAHLLEREQEARGQIAAAEERARIARELHDVLGHALSVAVLQVGLVRGRIEARLPAEAAALEEIERAATEALAEIRGTVRGMREAAPGLAGLDALLGRVRAAGLAVEMRVEGRRRPLPAPLDVAALRIIQEALTNVLRHAQATRANLVLRYRPAELELEVTDDGRGAGGPLQSGHGLLGLGERVDLLGGRIEAGPIPGGGFRLLARIPTTTMTTLRPGRADRGPAGGGSRPPRRAAERPSGAIAPR
ncbi:MAG: histidine kinase [Solirubrobacterales bacterium]